MSILFLKLWLFAQCGVMVSALDTAAVASSSSMTIQADPIKVQFTYEADCPFCSLYFANQMCSPFIKAGIESGAINLELLPYGNSQAWNTCQHGIMECKHNMVEACIIKHIPDPKTHLGVICCYEREVFSGHPDPIQALKTCSSSVAASQDDIVKCYGDFQGEEGICAVKAIAAKTPNHQYVPWISVGGQHDPQAEHSLHDRLCQLPPLSGSPACQGSGLVPSSFTAEKCWNTHDITRKGGNMRGTVTDLLE